MLTSLKLTNFRCFQAHTIELQPKTLLVGKNNAGKSTCVEALRLISLVTERLASLPLKAPPSWTDLPLRAKGVSPSLESIDIHEKSIFYNYNDPPAIISAAFAHGARVDVHIGPELALHAVIYDEDGQAASTRQRINDAKIPRVSILPQISPLQEGESVLDDSYVKQNLQTSRGSLHFRNQLRLFPAHFPNFQRDVSATWPGVAVEPLSVPSIGYRKTLPISLFIRDSDFTAEAAWMGHGLQMWLQTIWFLVRNTASEVLILDEPDVYMHADLQRKLVRMLLKDPRQFIVATHSPEMLAEVEPDSVVVLDRKKRSSKSATSSKAVQELLLRVGSVHNLSLARLASQRRLLLVEGKDVPILKKLQNVVDPDADRPIDTVPHVHIGGWSGWPSALTLARFFDKNATDEIAVHCILDRDYHPEEEVAERYRQATAGKIHLTIWDAKEIENFLIVPTAIARLIANRTGQDVDVATVKEFITTTVDGLKGDAHACTIEAYRDRDPGAGVKNAMKVANPIFAKRWAESDGILVVNGKDVLAAVFRWAQDKYNVSLSTAALIHSLRPGEVHRNVRDVLRSVSARS